MITCEDLDIKEVKILVSIFYRWLKSEGMYTHFVKEFIPERKDPKYQGLTIVEYLSKRIHNLSINTKREFYSSLIDRTLVYCECEFNDEVYNNLNQRWNSFFCQKEIERLLSRALSSISKR